MQLSRQTRKTNGRPEGEKGVGEESGVCSLYSAYSVKILLM